MNELPSVALTRRFLAECEHHGSQRLAVRLIAVGRSTGDPRVACKQRLEGVGRRADAGGGRLPGAVAHPIADDGDTDPGVGCA